MIRSILNSRYTLWLVLALPLLWATWGYATGRLFYGEVVHLSGEFSARLMIVAMAATPLVLMFPGKAPSRWLMRHRRAFGVGSFVYAAVHTLVYLDKTAMLADVIDDAADAGYLTGWIALLIFATLALTSNDASVRRLRSAWRRLHKLVYVAAVLTFAHWLLVAFSPGPALAHLALLGGLEGFRIWKQGRIRALARRGA
jgi:sulfoxide reductase heme-binding subunit YedZ